MVSPAPIDDPALHAAQARLHAACPDHDLRRDGLWIRVRMPRLDPALLSGWKLHLSAAAHNYPEFLNTALPLLLEADCPFKLAASVAVVEDLNDGRYGLGQVGKILTVYPPDEGAAAALARDLAEQLAGWNAGPVIAGDRRYRPDAPVYFRFGPFDARTRIDPMGRRRRLLRLPDGSDVIDPADGGPDRAPPPTILPDPPPADHLGFLRDAYLLAQVLHVSAKGIVALALPRRARPALPCLVKTAKHGAQGDRLGRDARWALRREHATLTALSDLPGFPAAGTLHEGPEATALVRPWLDGETLWARWTAPDAARPARRKALAETLRALAGQVAAAHARGWVLRDLSPGNILITDEGPVLLDVELAARLGDPGPPYRRGTPGFYDPHGAREAPPDPAHDHYGLLAMGIMVLRGEHPAWCPGGLHDHFAPGSPFQRDDDPGRAGAAAWAARGTPQFWGHFEAFLDCTGLAQHTLPMPLREQLLDAFFDAVDSGLDRLLSSPATAEAANVYSGAAGLLREALDLDPAALRSRLQRRNLRALADALVQGAREVAHLPGYYFGASGVAAVMVRLGALLEAPDWVTDGERLLHRIRAADPEIPDLCQGQAGLLLAALEVHALTGTRESRELAERTARHLLHLGTRDPASPPRWCWPQGDYGSLAGQAPYGYAHGLAGIVAVLFQAASQLKIPELQVVASAGLTELLNASKGIDSPREKSKLSFTAPDNCEGALPWWPVDATDDTCWNAWCHGTPGVVLALHRGHESMQTDGSARALQAALVAMAQANPAGWCLCHGLASRVHAWAIATQTGTMSGTISNHLHRDASVLAMIGLPGPVQQDSESTEDYGGLMTGPAGALAAALRAVRALSGRTH